MTLCLRHRVGTGVACSHVARECTAIYPVAKHRDRLSGVGRGVVVCVAEGRTAFHKDNRNMVGLECVCGEVFRAQCDVEPSGCAFTWILLSAIHAWRCCALECDDDSERSV